MFLRFLLTATAIVNPITITPAETERMIPPCSVSVKVIVELSPGSVIVIGSVIVVGSVIVIGSVIVSGG
ncbi:MAG: hypothetical protein ACTSP5_15185 [Candidatus Heimdallarchaeota archaeon]